MINFQTDKIKGFSCSDELIEVFDIAGKPFYYFLNENRARRTFNLPEGEFFTYNNLTELKTPLKYVCPKLPMDEKFAVYPDEFYIELKPNRNKCSVDITTGLIILDPDKEKEWEKPFLSFVLNHELGHVHYFTEWKCDLYSIKIMLENLGYNPSQCLYSTYLCLSDNNQERRNKAEKFLLNTKCYER